MTPTNSFRDLRVWKEAMTFVEEVYALSRRFPAEERFGLTSQLRRATISIPANIGEGGRRKRRKAHLNYLDIALGSQGGVEVLLEVSLRPGSCSKPGYGPVARRADDVGRMLNGLISSLQPTESDW